MIEILIHSRTHIQVDTPNGSFHITTEGKRGDLKPFMEISMHDHFSLSIIGRHKENPTISIDSDEYATGLKIDETEGEWNRVSISSRFLENHIRK